MANPKRDLQRQRRQERVAAMEAAKKKAAMRRRLTVFGSAAVVILVIWFVTSRGDDKAKAEKTTGPTTTTTAAAAPTTVAAKPAGSAAGKPCVAVSEPLPTGAPEVPVKTGPPPAKLVSEDLKVGTGAVVTAGAEVKVNYIGVSCSTGAIFDSSYSRGEPLSFSLTGVIPGWTNGIPGMKVGGRRLLGIPPADGYGPSGSGDKIGPDETLWFVVEVLETKPA